MRRKAKTPRRSNAGIGYNFDFHGAFNKKSAAAKKEAATPGAFIRPVYYQHGMRFAVLTRRAPNPSQDVKRLELFDRKRAELIKAGKPAAVASLEALEYVRKVMGFQNGVRKQNSYLDRFIGRKPRITSADWRRAGEARRRSALKSAGVPAKLLPVYVGFEWADLQQADPGFVSKVMTGLSKTYKNPRKKVAKRSMDAKRRRARTSAKRRSARPRSNPEQRAKAAKTYEMFHGRAPRKVTEKLVRAKGLPKNADYAKLGDLVELHIPAGADSDGVITFRPGERPILVTDPAAKRLFFIGGNQDLSAVPAVRKANPGKGLDDLGECTRIVYYSRKKFTDFKPVEWDHEFGEEGGQRPRLMFDRKRKQMHLVGGDYKIKEVGIVN